MLPPAITFLAGIFIAAVGPAAPTKPTSILEFGAKGDGAADDTKPFLDAHKSVPRGTIDLPAGIYKTTSVKLKPKLTYVGEGVEVSTLSLGSHAGTLITSDETNNSYSGLSRLTVRGDGATAGQKLLGVTGLYASYFNEVYFSSAENLVELSEVEGQTIFRDCYFTGAGANGYAVRLKNVQDVTIYNSPIERSTNGVYATRTNAVTRFKFDNIHSERVGRLFNIDTATNNGVVIFRDIAAFDVGAGLADSTSGYAFRVNNEYAIFDNVHVTVVNPSTPIITTPLWAIYARDCPSFTAADATTCSIPHFEIGYGSAYVPNSKRSILDATEKTAALYTASGGATVSTTDGFGSFKGRGQYRIHPVTGPTLSPTPITNKAIMVRFEYRSTIAAGAVLQIDGMNPQIIGYSGSTATRAGQLIQLPGTAGSWKKVYFYVRYTSEFDQASRFFYVNAASSRETMDIRAFDIFEVSRPPYSLMDW
jgi:hypothetical protein